jgi:hypothetical protein
METLREKMRIKQDVGNPQNNYQVIIPIPSKPEIINLNKMTIIDEQGHFDIAELTKKLEESKLKKVTIKPNVSQLAKREAISYPKKKVRKLTTKILTGLQDEGVAILPGPLQKQELEGPEEQIEQTEQTQLTIKPKVKRGRKTKAPERGVSILSPEEWVEIGDSSARKRLPEKLPKINYKVSSYFMNNREIFINSVNSLFEPYRDQILDDTSQITCENIGNDSKKFSLLIHQMVVRDYMNLYTPYRGLLLYHSLGSGKTCSSIALAEGMKNNKKIIVMTPASLRPNYISELKKCGDVLYKTNQYWEWIDTQKHPEAVDTLSSMLNLSVSYITKQGGAWLVNVSKTEPYPVLSPADKTKLDDQINEMIETKYRFINYNGLRRSKWKELTDDYKVNIFDDAVVIIDEAHNLISRIVNKIAKEKELPVDKRTGNIERRPFSLALNLYQDLMSAKNARIILITGTPIINYPNEVGILFNILRGFIKTWNFSLDIKTSKPINKETLHQMFVREKLVDYLEYTDKPSPKLTITRNPFGFENKEKADGYHGVTNQKERIDRGNIRIVEPGLISDDDFQRDIIRILKSNEIDVLGGPTIDNFKALPDKFDDFANLFIDSSTGKLTNVDMLKRRIMGLSSYFRSAQEKLLPRFDKLTDFKVIRIPMSDYQFTIYEEARAEERKVEKNSKTKKGKIDENGIYKDPTSTYRIFSRLFCNFVMPKPPGRPLPIENREVADTVNETKEIKEKHGLEHIYEKAQKKLVEEGKSGDEDDAEKNGDGGDGGDLEGDQVLDALGDTSYEKRMRSAIDFVKEHSAEYLSPEGLETYSPKYLNILENIQDPTHIGLHLIYSQFRTLEGIGMFTLVLEQNGYTQFKIKKDVSGEWEMDISEENRGKPTYALYTGTESKEEKETVRNIYNGDWSGLTPTLNAELNSIAHNNNVGEIIKVFMITAAGSEGINLRNTRYVHIMEPYWHPARVEQVIGRARRICSHKNLPEELQTVEAFVYLMTFSPEQISPKNDASIELKKRDLSKRKYKIFPDKETMGFIPMTSDQALFEISVIKEEVSTTMTAAIKESSIDCSLYSRAGAKEQLHCLSFGNPSPDKFSYGPDYKKDKPDSSAAINKEKINWEGDEITIRGKIYISRAMPEKGVGVKYIYDLDSFKRAQENPGVEPVLLKILSKNEKGENVLKNV